MEYEVDEEKQWENVNSNAKARKPDFIQKTARTYSPFMNKDVSKRGVSGSNEAVCKRRALGIISEESSCNTMRVGSWAYQMLQR